MLLIILIIACILVLLAYLVVTVRRHDRNAYADRERDPFYSEMARLAAAGLLYEEEERSIGRQRHSFIVTPAGEAVLRTGMTTQADAGHTLESWRAMGFDQQSLVADPMFVDAANDNYDLAADSPALKLGFKPIDTAKIGLVPDDE